MRGAATSVQCSHGMRPASCHHGVATQPALPLCLLHLTAHDSAEQSQSENISSHWALRRKKKAKLTHRVSDEFMMHLQPTEKCFDNAYLSQGGRGRMMELDTRLEQLDDVFGSASASLLEHEVTDLHPSDMHRLETEHATAGYREGVTAAKGLTVQAGFDEGFSLGSAIGLRAGQLLGMMEGIVDALPSRRHEDADASTRLLKEAQNELTISKIFDAEYWAPDGNWTFEVVPSDGVQPVFSDVANAHPLIQKWSRTVAQQAELWHINPSKLDHDSGPHLDMAPIEPLLLTAPARTEQPLDW